MIDRRVLMYDVRHFQPAYDWTINPVGQLVTIDPRIQELQITGRFCSGFNINNEGMFLTAGHCLTQGDTCFSLTNGQLSSYRISFNYQEGADHEYLFPINSLLNWGSCITTWGHSESTDYAVLQLSGSASKWGYLSPLINLPSENYDIVAVSHPNGEPKKISFGKVKIISENKNQDKFIEHSAPIERGSSGSPLSATIATTTTGTIAAALGINIRVHMDEKDERKVDHDKNHITVSIETVARKSPHVRRVSFFRESDGSLKSATVGVDLNQTNQENRRSNNCC